MNYVFLKLEEKVVVAPSFTNFGVVSILVPHVVKEK
jgi:hypothetical protein